MELFILIHEAPYGKVTDALLLEYDTLKSQYMTNHDDLIRLYPDPELRHQKFDSFIRFAASQELHKKPKKEPTFAGYGWGGGEEYPRS